ncbi:MAG: Na+/H+ antiporter subunit E, partial [Spirochaetia bacterium]|nr:Na+/H+ antiporter subunit E [Spirochaetia bacterium]
TVMTAIKKRLVLGIMLFILWNLIVYPINRQEIFAGAVISLFLISMPLPGLAVFAEVKLHPKRIFYAAIFIFIFLWEVVKSNIDVALRVLKPVIPMNPGIVKVKTKLKSRLGKLVLANAITLTPGTITVDTYGQYLYIHWISVDADGVDASTKKIVSHFEKYLEVIFG